MKFTQNGLATASLVIGAALMFALSLSSLFLDRAAVAGIAATVALAMVVLVKLPIIDSFEMLTLKVKLRHQVDEAGDLIKKIRSSASVTSKLLYLQLSYMNRMGTVSWDLKRKMLVEVDQMLGDLGIDESQVLEWKRPFMNLVMRDLLAVLRGSIDHLLNQHRQKAHEELNAYTMEHSPIDPNDARFLELNERVKSFESQGMNLGDVLQTDRLRDTRKITADWVSTSLFDAAEVAALEEVRSEVVSLADRCWEEGTISADAERYLEAYSNRIDTRIREIIGR